MPITLEDLEPGQIWANAHVAFLICIDGETLINVHVYGGALLEEGSWRGSDMVDGINKYSMRLVATLDKLPDIVRELYNAQKSTDT